MALTGKQSLTSLVQPNTDPAQTSNAGKQTLVETQATQGGPQQQQQQQLEKPDVSAIPAMDIAGEIAAFGSGGALNAAIVNAQKEMVAEQGVAGHTIAMFQYMATKAGALAQIIDGAFQRIPEEQRDPYLKALSGEMSAKLGDRGLWVGGDDRGMICVGALDAGEFFRKGKALLLEKGGAAQAQQRSLKDLLVEHSRNMDAKSYGRRVESMELIDVGALPVRGTGSAKPTAGAPIACNDPRCKYFDEDYAEVAGAELEAGKEYSLYFNGSENLEVTVQSNDGTHVVFSSVT